MSVYEKEDFNKVLILISRNLTTVYLYILLGTIAYNLRVTLLGGTRVADRGLFCDAL